MKVNAGIQRIKPIVFFLLFLFILNALVARSLCAQTPAPTLTANLENIQLKDFIKFVASYTGRNIVFQEAKIPATTVTIYSSQSMNEPELLAVFEQVLNSAALYSVSKGNILYVLNQAEAQGMEPEVRPQPGAEDELITTVHRLKTDLAPQMASQLLQSFASKYGQVVPIPQAQSVMIRDRRDRIDKMGQILNTVQTIKPSWKTEVIPLTQARSGATATKLTDFFRTLQERGQVGELPLISPIDWTNSLLVSGSAESLSTVRALIKQMDLINDVSAEQKLKVYRLQNAKAESAAVVLQALLGRQAEKKAESHAASPISGGGAQLGAAGLGASAQLAGSSSDKFMVSADKGTNSLLIMADVEFLAKVDEIVNQLDRPLDQVYIEALVMETTLDNSKKFGVEWMSGGGSGNTYVGTVGYMQKDSPLLSYANPVMQHTGGPNVAAAGSGFSLGILGNMVNYGGTYFPSLGALINFTKGVSDFNLISAPQIMTLDNSEAEIFVGDNIPYQTGSQTTQGGSTQIAYDYRDVGIKLVATPHVNVKNGLIRLDVRQEYKQQTSAGTLGLPTTSNRVTKTAVQLVDGSTMVISGLIENSQSRSQDSVPGLSQLPLLGWLFKNRSTSDNKKTLMIFISARILRTQESAESLSNEKLDKMKTEKAKAEDLIQREFYGVAGKKPTPNEPVVAPAPQQ
jgi:general secretion pathway protein D